MSAGCGNQRRQKRHWSLAFSVRATVPIREASSLSLRFCFFSFRFNLLFCFSVRPPADRAGSRLTASVLIPVGGTWRGAGTASSVPPSSVAGLFKAMGFLLPNCSLRGTPGIRPACLACRALGDWAVAAPLFMMVVPMSQPFKLRESRVLLAASGFKVLKNHMMPHGRATGEVPVDIYDGQAEDAHARPHQ